MRTISPGPPVRPANAALGSLAAAAALALATTCPARAGTSAAPSAAAPGTAAADAQARAAADCPQGLVCFWSEPSFSGEMRAVPDPQHECEATPVQPGRSVYNHGGGSRTFFSGPGCSVRVGTLEPRGSARSIDVSSWR
ncbi:peptidase inhibitor family I36 protein [Streptomyces sp. NPDC048506]|uniref:peptidase inhibitor family I36 protein n=1 Tax=Streptomyces sp. NPDC048506 TaxID=3155028 RepID=UPI003415FF41